MFEKLEDTIVAISSPPGRGQRGVLRLSGERSLEIAAALFEGTPELTGQRSPSRHTGRFALRAHQFVLPGELLVFRKPRSYTREDVVELHTVGAPAVLSVLISRALDLGARLAEPGEFTGRAFYRGGMNLAEVQGVAALIRARSDQQLRAAHYWKAGRWARMMQPVYQDITELVSLVEADIDFAEEPIEFIRPAELTGRIHCIHDTLSGVAQRMQAAEQAARLPRVLLVGPTNAGKSTLMNRLCGARRAICSRIEGSTRDLLSAVVRVPEGELELVDSPGQGKKQGKTEKNSKNFFAREIAHADALCYVLDLTVAPLREQVLHELESTAGRIMWVPNKADLISESNLQEICSQFRQSTNMSLYPISARTGRGCQRLLFALGSKLLKESDHIGNQHVAASKAQHEALKEALAALQRAHRWCQEVEHVIERAEWIATDLRSALAALGSLMGEVTTDDLLERIFDGFCIGK